MKRRNFLFGASASVVAGKALAQAGPNNGISPPQLGYDPQGTVGFPSVLRGSMDGTTYFKSQGGVLGSGLSGGQLAINAIALQATINSASARGKWLEWEEASYYYNSSTGLLVPYQPNGGNGFRWRSTLGTQFFNTYNSASGAPALTIGDPTGANLFYGLDWLGGTFSYGSSQTGLANAQTVVWGAMTICKIGLMGIGQPGGFPGYDGLVIANGGSGNFFSNEIGTLYIAGWQRHGMNMINAMGTGNIFQNVYQNLGASNTYNSCSGYYATFGTNVQTENKFVQWNFEWGQCPTTGVVLDVQGCLGLGIDQLHMEGILWSGFNPTMLQTANSNLKIGSWQIDNHVIQSANFTGSARLYYDYTPSPSNLLAQNLNFVNFTSGNVTAPFTLVAPAPPTTQAGNYEIQQISFRDQTGSNCWTGNASFDANMPTGSAQFLVPFSAGDYKWGASASQLDRGQIAVSGAYTHYGQLTDCTLFLAPSGTYTITLASVMGATGNQAVKLGTLVRVVRATYSSGTVTIAGSLGTLATNATTASLTFMFNGTSFVQISGVN